LIIGRNHHSTAFAGITEIATDYDDFTCSKQDWRSLAYVNFVRYLTL
jgi:hypothetical protein